MEKIGGITIFIAIIIIIILIYDSIIMRKRKKEMNEIEQTSEKIKKLNELNCKSDFKRLYRITHYLNEREYSRKSLDRLLLDSVIKYYIEINNDYIRDDIEYSIYNNNLYDRYYENVKIIENSESKNITTIPMERYINYENKIFKNLVIDKNNIGYFYKTYCIL